MHALVSKKLICIQVYPARWKISFSSRMTERLPFAGCGQEAGLELKLPTALGSCTLLLEVI